MKRIAALVAALAFCGASAAAAQVRGDRVRIASPEFTGEATVVSATPDTLVLMPRRGETAVQVARATIERLDVAVLPQQPAPRWSFHGCVIGAAVGAVAGAVAEAGGAPSDGVDRKLMWLTIGVGAAGCALGALIGGNHGGVVWEPLIAAQAASPAPDGPQLPTAPPPARRVAPPAAPGW